MLRMSRKTGRYRNSNRYESVRRWRRLPGWLLRTWEWTRGVGEPVGEVTMSRVRRPRAWRVVAMAMLPPKPPQGWGIGTIAVSVERYGEWRNEELQRTVQRLEQMLATP